MATRDDLNANAEFIRLADAFVEVPSGSNKVNKWILLVVLHMTDHVTVLI
jgi:hypothetical protein